MNDSPRRYGYGYGYGYSNTIAMLLKLCAMAVGRPL